MRNALKWMGVCTALAFAAVVTSCDDVPTEVEKTTAPTVAPEADEPLFATYPGVTDVCMGNDAVTYNANVSGFGPTTSPLAFNCTAGDVTIANARAKTGGPITCVEGETFLADIVADVVENAESARVDIGIWIENGDNGVGGAEDGDCDFFFFDGADIAADPTGYPIDIDGDECGDMNDKGVVSDFDLEQLTLVCPSDPVILDGKTYVEVASCVSWTQPGGDRVCYDGVGDAGGDQNPRAGTLPANKSKCNCEPFLIEVNIVRKATVEVVKDISPDLDPGTFDLVIKDWEGTTVASIDEAGDGDGAGPVELEWTSGSEPTENKASVAETGANLGTLDETTTPSAFDFYTTTYSCVEGNNGNGPVNGTGTGPVNLTLSNDDAWVCTFTNTRIPAPDITVDKTVVEQFDRDWDWTILKTADQGGEPPLGGSDVVVTALGQTIDANYTVKITGSYTDSDFRVAGVITVAAPASTAPYSGSVVVTDKVAGNDATVSNCSSTTLTPGNSITCDYAYTFPSAPTGSETNTAKAVVTWNTGDDETDFSPDKPISFDYPADIDTEKDDKVQVSDTNTQFGGPFTWDANVDGGSVDGQMKSWMYIIPLGCSDYGADFQVPNTADFTTAPSTVNTPDTGSDDWLINVICPSPPAVCTLTQGYWKNHCLDSPDRIDAGCNARWPDDNWLNVGAAGEDEMFYLSGDSWIGVFTTAPKGNVYYVLAHQWMAAELNRLNGAAIPGAVQTAYDAGLAILSNCAPNNLRNVKGRRTENCSGGDYTKMDMAGFADTLADFNEGLYSSACTEDASSRL